MNLYYEISALLNSILSLVLCLYVLYKNKRGEVNKAFSLFAFSVSFWSIGFFLMQVSNNSNDALFWSRIFMLGSIFIPTTFFHFISALLNLDITKKKEIIFAYCLSIIFAISDFTPYFIKNVEPRLQFNFWPRPNLFFHLFMFLFHGYVAYAFFLIYQQYNNLSDIKRNQVKYVMLGTLIGFIGGGSNHLLCYNIPVPPYGNALVSVYVITIAYAIIKYNLLDIRIAITRGTIFTIVYFLLFAVPIITALFVDEYFQRVLGKRWWIALFVIGGVLGYIAQMTYSYFREKAERKYIEEQEAFHNHLRNASNDMIHVRDLPDLQNRVVHILTQGIKITHVKLFAFNTQKKIYELAACRGIEERAQTSIPLDNDHSLIKLMNITKGHILFDDVRNYEFEEVNNEEVENEIRAMGAALILPNFTQARLIGFITLGSKTEGGIYTVDDINVLTTLANQVALAMENASLYNNLEVKVDERTKELNDAYNDLNVLFLKLKDKDYFLSEDLALAKKIQENLLLSHVKKIDNFDIYIKYLPMSIVGGDIYDIFEMGSGIVRIFIADASGHGIQAALITMIIKSEYKQLKEKIESPAEVLELLNNIFIDSYKVLPVLYTCAIVDIDLDNRKIRFSSSGHPTQILVTESEIHQLPHMGRLIGASRRSKYNSVELPFNNDDKLFLFTDGIFEQFNIKKEEFGENRIIQIIERNRNHTVKHIINTIIAELEEFLGSDIITENDDITIIGLRCRLKEN